MGVMGMASESHMIGMLSTKLSAPLFFMYSTPVNDIDCKIVLAHKNNLK